MTECVFVTTPNSHTGSHAGLAVTWHTCVGPGEVAITFDEDSYTLSLIQESFENHGSAHTEFGMHYASANQESADAFNYFGTVSGHDSHGSKLEATNQACESFVDHPDIKTPRLLNGRKSLVYSVNQIIPRGNGHVLVLGSLRASWINPNADNQLYYRGKTVGSHNQKVRHYSSLYGFTAEFPY